MKFAKMGALSAALMMTTGTLFAEGADIDGAVMGKWTMDLDAAKKVAVEKQLPILLDFSGSDWCGWCKLMEESVFSKPEWAEYAGEHIMMVLVDFPEDKSLVPEKYVARNNELKEEYGISGFPTFIIIAADGETELGRLSAGRDKTPASFIAEVEATLQNTPQAKEEFLNNLSPEKKAEYQKLTQKLEAAKNQFDQQVEVIQEAQKKADEMQMAIMKAEGAIATFRMEQKLSPEDFKVYQETRTQYDAAVEKLTTWIAGEPEQNEENMKLYQEMISEIQTLEGQLSAY